jgi:hypothetical protein
MPGDDRVTYEASVSDPEDGEPARVFVWIRRFQGDEEITGSYEVFEDLARLDDFIARATAAGQETAGLRSARERFAESLGKAT